MHNLDILVRRIDSAISRIGLDLRGQNVLTETASGPYLATPMIAALAGASHVAAVTRDSHWGSAADIRNNTLRLAAHLGVASSIEVSTGGVEEFAANVDVVTNLGFVRPISSQIIARLPVYAAIGLMWEPWEFRSQDIDLSACAERNIPVIATNENHPDVATFRFVGLLALKLLFEAQIEVLGLRVMVIGSDPFGFACVRTLEAVGATGIQFDPTQIWPPAADSLEVASVDAILVVEHRYSGLLLGESICPLVAELIESRIPVIHICGFVDAQYLAARNCAKYPVESVPFGYMTVTTAHIGAKPVVDLHCAGLHVTSLVARARKSGASLQDSIAVACKSGFGLPLEIPYWLDSK